MAKKKPRQKPKPRPEPVTGPYRKDQHGQWVKVSRQEKSSGRPQEVHPER